MKIYELIYYWDDCAYGCDISNTILVKSQEEVEKLKADFCANQSQNAKLEIDTPENMYHINIKKIDRYSLLKNIIYKWIIFNAIWYYEYKFIYL